MRRTQLSGRRVVLTRAEDDAQAWARTLAALGAEPEIFPCITTSALTDDVTQRALLTALSTASWLLLFSRRGVEATGALLRGALESRVRLGVVGPATAAAARAQFGRVNLVPPVTTGVGLAQELAAILSLSLLREPTQVVLAGAESGQPEVQRILEDAGARVSSIAVYRTVPAAAEEPRRTFDADDRTDILVASPSAVTGLLNRAVVPEGARIITIGPTTTAAARAAGLRVAAEARRPDLEGMLEVL